MKQVTLEELLEAGCHFGHQVTRSNPRARDFIFEAREGIHIIDLAKTKEGLDQAGEFVKAVAQKEDSVMVVVGTKRQAHGIIEEEARKAKEEIGDPLKDGIFYVTNRWIGGLFTNFSEVSKNFKKLIDLTEKLKNPEERAKYTKKEVGLWDKERQKLESLYGGVYQLKKEPELLFVVDSHLEDLAVREAQKVGVPTVAIVDTNADPHIVDYPIPANDDAVGSIQLIVGYIMGAWVEGKKIKKPEPKPEAAPASAPAVAKALAGKKATVGKKDKPVRQAQGKKDVKSKPRTAKKTS